MSRAKVVFIAVGTPSMPDGSSDLWPVMAAAAEIGRGFATVVNKYTALEGADAMILVTEWKPFRAPDLALMKRIMRRHVIVDGRNQYDRKAATAAGFEYFVVDRYRVWSV